MIWVPRPVAPIRAGRARFQRFTPDAGGGGGGGAGFSYRNVELPRANVDTSGSIPGGTTAKVAPAGQTMNDTTAPTHNTVQAAVDSGAELILVKGGPVGTGPTWNEEVVLRNHAGTTPRWIMSDLHANLPAAGQRVSPSDAANMFYMQRTTHDAKAFTNEGGAHHWRIVGAHLHTGDGGTTENRGLIFWKSPDTASNIPHHMIADRCLIHGRNDPGNAVVFRGVSLHADHSAVINSYIYDITNTGFDSQAVWSMDCRGPVLIENCYLEASGENFMSGGGGLQFNSQGIWVSDLTFRRNYCKKPVSWFTATPTVPSVKNLFEIKVGSRFLVTENVFDTNWQGGQDGLGWLAKSSTDGTTPMDGGTEDVTATWNKLINAPGWFGIAGDPDSPVGFAARRFYIADNLMEMSGHDADPEGYNLATGARRNFWLDGSAEDVYMHRNRCRGNLDTGVVVAGPSLGNRELVDCVFEGSMNGDAMGGNVGNTIATYWTGGTNVVTGNAFVGGGINIPPGNTTPADDASAVGGPDEGELATRLAGVV